MSTLPPVADPTTSMPPPSVESGVLATPASAAASTLAASTVAPVPVRAPMLSAAGGRPVAVLGAQAPTTTTATATATATAKPSSKSKKKGQSGTASNATTVTMATAATAQSAGGQGGSHGENTGRWTAEEHNLFLQGLELHGKGWKKIAGLIKSRTVVQIRTHAQKYFQKLAKAKQNGEDVTMAGGSGSSGGVGVGATMTMMMGEGGRSTMSGGGGGANGAGSAMSSSSTSGVGHATAHTNKRRKQTSGTKRKAIQSVVASARREGNKKLAVTTTARTASTHHETAPTATSNNLLNPAMHSVAPALAPYVLPTPLSSMCAHQTATIAAGDPSIPTAQGAIGVTALEDSLYVFVAFCMLALVAGPGFLYN